MATRPSSPADPLPSQIDLKPEKAANSQVVARRDIVLADRPACALTVRYQGHVEQPVTWHGERCKDIDIYFVSAPQLAKLGHDAKISSETDDDIASLPAGRTLYIEGKKASAIYPANAMERIYVVALAD